MAREASRPGTAASAAISDENRTLPALPRGVDGKPSEVFKPLSERHVPFCVCKNSESNEKSSRADSAPSENGAEGISTDSANPQGELVPGSSQANRASSSASLRAPGTWSRSWLSLMSVVRTPFANGRSRRSRSASQSGSRSNTKSCIQRSRLLSISTSSSSISCQPLSRHSSSSSMAAPSAEPIWSIFLRVSRAARR